jgi:predicted anti-sigma-YlaC factor YlaD
MDCDRVREALSARLDDEDPGLPEQALDRHLAACAGCQSWAASAGALNRVVRIAPAEAIPDLTPEILAAARLRPQAARARLVRWALGLVGILQLAVSVPVLVLGAGSAPVHVARELASLDLALAVGFIVAAWRPHRAWGMLPLVAVLVASLAATAGLDLAEGHASAERELLHGLDLAGLALLWVLGRRPGPVFLVRRTKPA